MPPRLHFGAGTGREAERERPPPAPPARLRAPGECAAFARFSGAPEKRMALGHPGRGAPHAEALAHPPGAGYSRERRKARSSSMVCWTMSGAGPPGRRRVFTQVSMESAV